MATKPFHLRISDEQAYMQQILSALQKRVASLLAGSDPLHVVTDLPGIAANSQFQALADAIAARMVNRQRVQNTRSWREAASRSQNGHRIYAALELELAGERGARMAEIVQRNAALIKSIPRDLSASATKLIVREQQSGRRSEDIMRDLRKHIPAMTKSKAKLIARTEVGKAESALTQARSESIGIEWYLWRTSEDAFVRPAHRLLDGVLVPWSNAPSPEKLAGVQSSLGTYHAGCAPNCRCVSVPLVTLDQVKWPCRVYVEQKIVRMARARFAMLEHRIAA